MSKTSSEQGYGAAKSGGSKSDNPYDNSGVLGRMFDITVDVLSGGLANQLETNDKNDKDWRDGFDAGSSDDDDDD